MKIYNIGKLSFLSLLCLLPVLAQADFSSDGKRIIFQDSEGISVVNIDGSELTRVPQAQKWGRPSWSSHGNLAVVTSGGNKGTSIAYLYDAKTNTTRKIGSDFRPPFAWREDGDRFAAIQQTEGGGLKVLFYDVVNRSVTYDVTLPVEEVIADQMVWIPGTDDVAFVGRKGTARNVYRVEQGIVKQITTSDDVLGLSLYNQGKNLIWARVGKDLRYILLSLYVYDLQKLTVLPRLPFPERVTAINPGSQNAPVSLDSISFAPDGTQFALVSTYSSAKPTTGTGQPSNYQSCFLVSIDGKSVKQVRKSDPFVAVPKGMVTFWSPDSKRMAIWHESANRLALILYLADGTPAKALYTAPLR